MNIQASMALAFLAAGSAWAARIGFRQSGFGPDPDRWTVWSDRVKTAPRAFVETMVLCGEADSLAVSGNGDIDVYGGWQRTLPNVRAGAWHRFAACYQANGVTSENWQILPRLDWRTAAGRRAGSYEHVDYAPKAVRQGDWARVTLETEAPPGSAAVVLQLFLAHAPSGIVWWDDVVFEQIPAPGPRKVAFASVNLMPEKTGSPADSVCQFLETADRLAPSETDLILLLEAITVVGTGLSCAEVAEPVPEPTAAGLGELARGKRAYVAASIDEREGAVVYNTAVLLDRSGNLAGRYRKVHLPRSEMEQMTPGNEYPVFRTGFGIIGMRGTAAIAAIDLNRTYLYWGLWDWKNRRAREYHPEVKTRLGTFFEEDR